MFTIETTIHKKIQTIHKKIRQRIIWIDYAKAIGITLVVFAHMPSVFANYIFLFHMPLFFMLSGYLYKPIGLKSELKRSLQCLIIPYIAYNLMLMFLSTIQGKFELKLIRDVLLGNQELLPHTYRALWFVVSLFLMRLIMSSIKSIKIITAVILLDILAFIILRNCNLVTTDCDLFQINTTILCFPFFCTGILIKHFSLEHCPDKIKSKYKFVIFSIFVIALFFTGHVNGKINVFRCETGKNLVIFYITTLLISYVYIYACHRLFNKRNKIVETFSAGTLLILALHQLIIHAFNRITELNTITSIIGTIFIMALCYPLSRFCIKYFPLMLLGKRNSNKVN